MQDAPSVDDWLSEEIPQRPRRRDTLRLHLLTAVALCMVSVLAGALSRRLQKPLEASPAVSQLPLLVLPFAEAAVPPPIEANSAPEATVIVTAPLELVVSRPKRSAKVVRPVAVNAAERLGRAWRSFRIRDYAGAQRLARSVEGLDHVGATRVLAAVRCVVAGEPPVLPDALDRQFVRGICLRVRSVTRTN